MHPAAKAGVDKEWEKLEKISAWNLTKVRSKKEAIDEARTSGAVIDICHVKNAELEAKHQIYKRRVAPRNDIVKYDFGFYVVFPEPRSSASQMTATKVMDIMSILPRCAGEATDVVSVYTVVDKEDASKIIENSKIGVSRHLDSSSTTQMARIIVRYGRPHLSSWTKSVQ